MPTEHCLDTSTDAPASADGPVVADLQPHRQVTVTVGEWSADVDELLAPLIEALWVLGIRTIFSCQSQLLRLNMMRVRTEMFYVMFPDTEDLRRMLTLFVDTPFDPRRLQTTWHYALFARHDPPGTEPSDPLVGLHPIVYLALEYLDDVTAIARTLAGLSVRAA